MDLYASRSQGTARQLFGGQFLNEGDPEEFLIRPKFSRHVAHIATAMGDLMSFADKSIVTAVENITIDRLAESDCSIDEFQHRFQVPGNQKPAMISGCTLAAPWPAGSLHWDIDVLESVIGRNRRFEAKDANATVKFGDFIDYMRQCTSAQTEGDDNPVYIWETLVDGIHDDIINNFVVPKYFSSCCIRGIHAADDEMDLFSDAGIDGTLFGLHRWLLIGRML